jgi:predicted O-methyltransferase YrrM
MRVRPNRSDWRFADELFRRYQAKPGSEQIASRAALAYLSACLRLYRPSTVIECGAGIGTITDALLRHESGPRRLVSFENNEFCLGELARNIAHHDRSRLTIVAGVGPSPITDADMIIGDDHR